MKKKFRTKYEPRVVRETFKGVKSLTDPQYLKDCDLEQIIAKYGVLPRPKAEVLRVDVSDVGDFATALRKVQNGLDQFSLVPSDIRARFGNDPAAFFAFVVDPKNLPELERLGLAQRVPVERKPVEVLEEIASKMSPATPAAGA